MSKLVKDYIAAELRGRYSGVESALLVEYVGVDGETNTTFRRALRKKKLVLEIVQNSMLKRAVAGTRLEVLGPSLKGPSALVTGGESAVDAAKVLFEWKDKVKGLRLKAAVLEGEFIDERTVVDLYKMPTKRDVQAQIVGQALSPGGKLAAILKGAGNVGGLIKALIEKQEQGEEIKKIA
jgi:large subunit ribosomal protein L10